jgi:hypothetical protein
MSSAWLHNWNSGVVTLAMPDIPMFYHSGLSFIFSDKAAD